MELCVICYSENQLFCVGECKHPICVTCGLRLRVICETNNCPICNLALQKVVVVEATSMLDTDIDGEGMDADLEKKYGVIVRGTAELETVGETLANVCTHCEDRKEFPTFTQLRDHLRTKHRLHYCELCLKNLKLFPSERKCYTRSQLAQHEKKGDDDEPGYYGHPVCTFCGHRNYSEDDLYKHSRQNHYICHDCDQNGKNVFCCTMKDLREHWSKEHPKEQQDLFAAKFAKAKKDRLPPDQPPKPRAVKDFLPRPFTDEHDEYEFSTPALPTKREPFQSAKQKRADSESSDSEPVAMARKNLGRFVLIDDDEDDPLPLEKVAANTRSGTQKPLQRETKSQKASEPARGNTGTDQRDTSGSVQKSKDDEAASAKQAPMAEENRYVRPREFGSRNRDLMQTLAGCMRDDDDRIDAFKQRSLDFQRGIIDASTACMWMRVLIDDDGAYSNLFDELLCLLPNIEKQQALLDAFRGTDLRYCQDGIRQCKVCGQWLLKVDYTEHTSGAHTK